MTGADVLIQATRYLLALVALLALVDFLRHRDRGRFNISLMLTSLGISILAHVLPDTISKARWFSALTTMMVMAQPYLLLRLVQHFRRVPQPVLLLAITGMALSWTLLAFSTPPLPKLGMLVIVAYFLLVEVYAIGLLVQRALTTGGAIRWRLGLIACGSGLLAGTILLAGVNTIGTSPVTPLHLAILELLIGLCYFVGFVPPVWLRRVWQLPELYRFLRTIAGQPASERAANTMDHLCQAASRSVVGLASMVALWDSNHSQLNVVASDSPLLKSRPISLLNSRPISLKDGAIGRSSQLQQSTVAGKLVDMGQDEARVAELVGASALICVPIATRDHAWGMLVVFRLSSPLFPADDLAILTLLSQQCAVALDNADLVNQQKAQVAETQAANQELEAFTYSVSHDLRAPLRAMDGFSGILLAEYATQLPATGQHYLQLVRDNAQQMGRLIDDLLTFSRLGRQPLRKQEVEMTGLVRQVAQELHASTSGRNIQLSIADLPSCQGDPALLKQVWVNLLSNALKYTRQRPVGVIDVGHQRVNGEEVYFVKDNGVGFDMKYANKLFAVFQRLHLAEEYEGTGVGLAIVRRMISRHGGRVWAEAAVNQGASFYFALTGGDDSGQQVS